MITLKQLHYALAAEKTLHFKRASEICHVSQSALSTALMELEKQLGLQIFERDNKKVLITPVGEEVLQRAREIMQQVDDLQHLAERQKAPLSFPLTLGAIPTIAPYLLPMVFPMLNQAYPQAQIAVVEEQSHTLVSMVKNGEIDTAIIALPFDCEGLLSMEFWQEDFYWVTLKQTSLLGKKEISSKDINENELMLLNEGHCLKEHALTACKFSGQKANHGFGASSLTTLMQMVLGGLGSTLIPDMARKQLIGNSEKLSTIHINEPGPHRRIAFIVRPNYTRMSSIEALSALCKASLRENQTQQ